MSLDETIEPPKKKLKTSGGINEKADKKDELPENYKEIRKFVKANRKLERDNCLHYKAINNNRNEIRTNYDKLKKICPHKWERDWNDRSHKTSRYCVWCGI
jgi:hypothetical protein